MQNTLVTPVINTVIPIEKPDCKYVNSPSGCTQNPKHNPFHFEKFAHPSASKNEDNNLLKRIEQLENDRIADKKQFENDRIADKKQFENDLNILKEFILRSIPSIQSEPKENCSMIETQWNPQQSYQPAPIQIQSFNPEKQNYRAPRNNYVNPEKKPYSGPKPKKEKKEKKEKIPNPVEHATFEKKYSPPPNGNNFNKKERARPTLNNGWGTPAGLEDGQGWGKSNESDENPGW